MLYGVAKSIWQYIKKLNSFGKNQIILNVQRNVQLVPFLLVRLKTKSSDVRHPHIRNPPTPSFIH